MMKNVALIGLGPHARRIYYPYLQERVIRGDIRFSLIIDLEQSRLKIEDFISKQAMRPDEVMFLDFPVNNDGPIFDKNLVSNAFKQHGITHVIIATEPKAHKEYLEFCIKNDLQILTDKPITSPRNLMPSPRLTPEESSLDGARLVEQDVVDLIKLLDAHPTSHVTVQTQRRYHAAYEWILSEISKVVNEYKVPVTYVDIYHSDGMWNMPEEFQTRENHPYKYGYGKLMHSGYHFVDLMRTILRVNDQLIDKTPDSLTLFNQVIRPADHAVTISAADYNNFFGEGNFSLPPNPNHAGMDEYDTYGELDTYSQWQFTRKGKVITTARMALMQTGFSLRAWAKLPEDTYKGNGRVRHESVNIHVGPLMNIQVHSYQAVEVGDSDLNENGVGTKNHFDIYVFRNTKLIGGTPLQTIRYGDNELLLQDGTIGQNEQPRFKALDEFLSDDTSSKSDLRDHLATNRLMSMLYSNQARQNYGHTPVVTKDYKEIFSA